MPPVALSGKTMLAAIAVVVAVAGGTAGLAAGSGSKGPLRCEIAVTPQGGMLTLEAMVFSTAPVDGTYSLTVAGSGTSGSSSIQQGGAFSATGSSRGNSLGTVSVGSKGAGYDAKLEVRAGGRTIACSESIDGRI